ncbi:hypothetical protein [Dyella sp. Tek66A03]|uniref:hypothetical protein n=1 Tax=Dyella sp. Tek66A03 TaxID=3458298 RepID=UPI00403EB8B4
MTKKSDKEEPQAGSRWWEFYLVRYATGTVVGALIVYFLFQKAPVLQPLLPLPKDAASLKSAHVLLLGAYGLTFCYIASAPMLVLHAVRYSIDVTNHRPLWKRPLIFLTGLAAILGGAYALTKYLPSTDADSTFVSFGSAALFGGIIAGQLWLVIKTLVKSDELYAFYKRLAGRRASAKERGKGDIIESYRHLREHGNSFSIVFLELTLGAILYSFGTPDVGISRLLGPSPGSIKMYIFALFLWMLPAAMVWLIATAFERRFADDGLVGKADEPMT